MPPEATGEEYIGHNIQKQVHPGAPHAVEFGGHLTYTVGVLTPESKNLRLRDPVPTYTTCVSGSLRGPSSIGYDPEANVISGTLSLTPGVSVTVSFAAQVDVTHFVRPGKKGRFPDGVTLDLLDERKAANPA